MKIHLYIAMLWVISLLAGCNDVTVGYLYTTEASYSMDTLQVTRFSALEDNINELERVFQIEQVLGTEPLHYSLYRVKSSNGQEAADDFAKYMTVIGGGRMYVDAKVDSPVGYYTVSLKIENEGHTAILEDIFTFEVRDN